MGGEVYEGFDRVTTIANFLGKKFAPSARGEEAKDIGTTVDEIIKRGLVKGVFSSNSQKDEVQRALAAFNEWNVNYGLKLKCGDRYFNTDLSITGESDLETDDEIIDIKCAMSIRPEYWIQLGGYCCLCPEIKKVSILRLDKSNGRYEYKSSDDVRKWKTLFVSCLNLYRYYKEVDGGYEAS